MFAHSLQIWLGHSVRRLVRVVNVHIIDLWRLSCPEVTLCGWLGVKIQLTNKSRQRQMSWNCHILCTAVSRHLYTEQWVRFWRNCGMCWVSGGKLIQSDLLQWTVKLDNLQRISLVICETRQSISPVNCETRRRLSSANCGKPFCVLTLDFFF